MSKSVTAAGLAAALAFGIALPLVFEDERDAGRPHLSVADVEHRLGQHPLGIPFARVGPRRTTSVSCKPHGNLRYDCLVGHSEGSEAIVSYDVSVPSYEPSSERRAEGLRGLLDFGYRGYCRRRPPPIQVRCEDAKRTCEYRIGGLSGTVGYDASIRGLHC